MSPKCSFGTEGQIKHLKGHINYLDYGVLGATPVAGQHLGIMLIELGVGMTVSAVVISFFYGFTNR